MNTHHKNEDLLYSLPDYITGKLVDEDLKFRIENEINLNTDFKQEYEMMKETYSSIKDLQFSEPPAHYFNNLVPRLNQRIESVSKFSFSHLFRLANLFKYALPAVSVIVLIVIFTFPNKSNKNENMFKQTDNTITEIMKANTDTLQTDNETVENTSAEENIVVENIQENETTPIKKEKNRTEKTIKVTNLNNVNIEDMIAETETIEKYDDYVYENDFNSLSQKDQTDLINKLSKTKF